MNAKDLYDDGKLDEAIAAAGEVVRAKPRDQVARFFLCELLSFAGQVDRADKQLDALAQLDPQAMLPVALFRQLLRGELARQEFYSAGRVPEFVGEISDELKLRLTASIQLRDNDPGAAAQSLEAAERLRQPPRGICDGKTFSDLRDMDDLTASVLEVLTSTGKYYWIPFDRLVRIEFKKPLSVRDLIWRQAEVKVHDGPDGVVYLPALYPGSAAVDNDLVRLGRMTDWLATETGPVRGIGQRMLLIDNDDRAFMELGCLEFAAGAP